MAEKNDMLAAQAVASMTGAKARVIGPSGNGLKGQTILELDWGRAPGADELPKRVTLSFDPDGGYEARVEGADTPFSSGPLRPLVQSPSELRIVALIRITDPETFMSEMGVNGTEPLGPDHFRAGMLRLPAALTDLGLLHLTVTDMSVFGEKAYFKVTAEVADMAAMVRAAREAYNECWWDNTWLPRSPHEALFEIALGSNSNPSPSDMGFEFLDHPQTRDADRIREAADTEVSASPALIPEERVTYAEWLELTGLDDSFVGDGRERPGTRDLFDAAIRALPRPDPSGPEPD